MVNGHCAAALLVSFLIVAALPVHAAGLPPLKTWPKPVALMEQPMTFTPVAGRAIRAILYSSDAIQSHSAIILLAGQGAVDTLCLQIDTHDGKYFGKGMIAGPVVPPVRLKVTFKGEFFDDAVDQSARAALLAWPGKQGQCDLDSSDNPMLFPASWESTEAKIPAAKILVNSGGAQSVQMVLRHDEGSDVVFHACDITPPDERPLVYDTVCAIDLCSFGSALRTWVRVQNYGRDKLVEEITTPSLAAVCGTSQ